MNTVSKFQVPSSYGLGVMCYVMNKRVTDSINYEGVCRTAQATPGLWNIIIFGREKTHIREHPIKLRTYPVLLVTNKIVLRTNTVNCFGHLVILGMITVSLRENICVYLELVLLYRGEMQSYKPRDQYSHTGYEYICIGHIWHIWHISVKYSQKRQIQKYSRHIQQNFGEIHSYWSQIKS